MNIKTFLPGSASLDNLIRAFGQGPTIALITPATGSLEKSVTITGSNFNATPANSIQYFEEKARALIYACWEFSMTTPVRVTVQAENCRSISSFN